MSDGIGEVQALLRIVEKAQDEGDHGTARQVLRVAAVQLADDIGRNATAALIANSSDTLAEVAALDSYADLIKRLSEETLRAGEDPR